MIPQLNLEHISIFKYGAENDWYIQISDYPVPERLRNKTVKARIRHIIYGL